MQTRQSEKSGAIWKRTPLLLAGLLGGAFAFWRFGPEVFAPENISWFRGDSVWHFLSWNFFRNEPWHLPPGRLEGFLAPLGTSIGGGDALPLLAFPFKLLNPLLPGHFQYLGLWLLINYVLQGVFGYLLVRIFCLKRWLALLAAVFFVFSPVMIFRAGHIALSSHWLILFALWHYFSADKQRRQRPYGRSYAAVWLLIVGLAGLVHPYLAAMVCAVAFVSILRSWQKGLETGYAFALGLGLLALLGLEWWASGIFGLGKGGGFDFYTLNPNSLINPLTHSRFLPALPVTAGQYEGFAYLGLGSLILGVVALLNAARTPQTTLRRAFEVVREHLPLVVLCAGLSFFALGNTVVFILEVAVLFAFLATYFVRHPPSFLERSRLPRRSRLTLFLLLIGVGLFAGIPLVTSTFRAPGRFIWPVYYLLYLGLIVYLIRRFSAPVALSLLLLGLSLQLADLNINKPFNSGQTTFTRHLKSKRWVELIGPFDKIAVIPPFELSVGGRDDYADFSFLASSHGKKVTTGVLVRIPGAFGARHTGADRRGAERASRPAHPVHL